MKENKITEGLPTLFDAFYSQFVLRDLLAKMAPGALVLFTIFIYLVAGESSSTISLKSPIVCYLLRLSSWTAFWTWIFVAAFSWIIGFAIQGLGEILQIIHYHPPPPFIGKDKTLIQEKWYKMQNDLPKSRRKLFERFTVIKETCGNGAIALSISITLLRLKGVINDLWLLPFLLSVCLWYMHVAHVQREYTYISVSLKKDPNYQSLPTISKWDLIKACMLTPLPLMFFSVCFLVCLLSPSG